MEAVKQSLRHLKYEEFLKFQLSMQALKARDTEMVQGSAKQFSMEDPGKAKEIGWGTVSLTVDGRLSPLRYLEGVPVLHWHGDTFLSLIHI